MKKKQSNFSLFGYEFKKVKESGNVFDYMRSDVLGTMQTKFAKDIYTRTILDIHEEMRRCKKYYRENAHVHASALGRACGCVRMAPCRTAHLAGGAGHCCAAGRAGIVWIPASLCAGAQDSRNREVNPLQ